MTNDLMGERQAAAFIGCSWLALKHHVQKGSAPGHELIANRRFYSRAVLESWMKKHGVKRDRGGKYAPLLPRQKKTAP